MKVVAVFLEKLILELHVRLADGVVGMSAPVHSYLVEREAHDILAIIPEQHLPVA